MSKKQLLEAILRLPAADRVELMQEVEDHTLPDESGGKESSEFTAELNRRYNDWLKNPGEAKPWAQVTGEMKALIQKTRQGRGKSKSSTPRKENLRRRSSGTK